MTRHVRTSLWLLVCLALGLCLQGCAAIQARLGQRKLLQLKVVSQPFLSYAPFYIAQEEGYFAEQGLEIEFVKSGSEEAVPGLAQGQLDVLGGTLSTALLKAMAWGEKIKFVADRGYVATGRCAYSGLVARKDLVESGELKDPAQLKGRRVALGREEIASMNGYRLDKLLALGHLTFDDVELVDVPSAAQLDAFGKGTLDLTGTSEPWITRLVNTGHAVLWVPAEQVMPDFQMLTLVYGASLLKGNPDVGRRFMVAYQKAVQQYNQGKTERNLEIMAEFSGLDRDLLNQSCWPDFRDDGHINITSILEFQDWAIQKGYLDQAATEEQFWDPSFVDYANGVLKIP